MHCSVLLSINKTVYISDPSNRSLGTVFYSANAESTESKESDVHGTCHVLNQTCTLTVMVTVFVVQMCEPVPVTVADQVEKI
jgi:hypothetical protein